ncbi:zinc ribbon domain-containing protein [Vibrio splendidus]
MAKQAEEMYVEERADYLTESSLKQRTAMNDYFSSIRKVLLDKGTKLIVGPRGCGKTHLMRYSWIECKTDKSKPLAIYVSFNKYFRLEPLLKSKPNATSIFNAWVLAKILLSAYESVGSTSISQSQLSDILITSKRNLESIISKLELQIVPKDELYDIYLELSVTNVVRSIERLCYYMERKRVVILLDDAAISLTPEYLYEFFDIVRSLKTSKISLKASVYPGTTEYGPNFHVDHEAERVMAWLDVRNPSYEEVMENIGINHVEGYESIPDGVRSLLKYASFGIPRSYLTMLRSYLSGKNLKGQQKLNKILTDHCLLRLHEYSSLKTKMPKYSSIINTGAKIFDLIIDYVAEANRKLIEKNDKSNQFLIGVQEEKNSKFSRMIQLLVEVGLLYPLSQVKHGKNEDGTDRYYNRYMVHLSFLINAKAFSTVDKKTSSSESTVEFIRLKQTHHPVRRNITKLFSDAGLSVESDLAWVLPPCSNCNAQRLSDNQRFCHECGSRIVDNSTFQQCMLIKLVDLPNLSPFFVTSLAKLKNQFDVETIGDFVSLQDPGSNLRSLHRIGIKRAQKVIGDVDRYVDEFLS